MDVENTDRKSRPGEDIDSAVTSVDFDQPDSMVGRTLDGRFLIEKNLTDGGADEGGIGVVYLARDTKMINKRVVVKILQEAALKYKDILRKFLHEEEALMRLDHPNIVRILDFGKLTDGNPFMVMEYIEGYSLRKALRTKSPFSLEYAAHLIESITDALSAAHAEKIIHRDIKPENIMLTPHEGGFERVRLIDFGIARVDESTLAPVTEISRAIGTVRYISPEQLAGSLYLGPTADIYSAGVVAYEMLTGQLPFRPGTMVHMYRLQQEGLTTTPRELRQEIPPAAEEILLSALEFDAENRPQNAREFGRDLARTLRSARLAPLYETEDLSTYRTELAGDEVVTAVSPSGVRPTFPAPEKSSFPLKWIAAATLSFVALTLIAGIVAWNFWTPPPPSPPPTIVAEAPERQISYHLMIQKMRGKVAVGEPLQLANQAYIADPGTKISMVFEADSDGYFYLWNEGKSKEGKIEYYPLFPLDDAPAKASAGQVVATGQNTFGGTTGIEAFYLVWSKVQLTDLETMWKSRSKVKHNVEGDETIATLRAYQKRYEDDRPTATVDETAQKMRIKSKKDVVVYKFTMAQQ